MTPIDVIDVVGHKSVLAFYRSVVFHPSGQSVLPGTLRSVYTLKGDQNDLFPDSQCTFSHCVFPRDKRIISTDCSDDPKMVILWSMKNGEVLMRIAGNDAISSFAISQDGSQIAFGDLTGSVYLVEVNSWQGRYLFTCTNTWCALMHFTPDNEVLVCGYLNYQVEGLDCGGRQYGWVSQRDPSFFLCQFKTNFEIILRNQQYLPTEGFVLWPIEPSAVAKEDFFDEGLRSSWVNKVHSVFPSLQTGFYKKLNKQTALVGSPSFKYVAAVNIDLLNEVTSASTSQVVTGVVFSSEGDAIYSISSDGSEYRVSEVEVTVIRMSSQEVLRKKVFSCQSLSLVPVKDGVVLCLKHQVPKLWDFELTDCIRPLSRLARTEMITRLSHELIVCQLRTSEEESPLEIHGEDDAVELDEPLTFDGTSNKAVTEVSSISSPEITFSLTSMNFGIVEVINVTSGECVFSVKIKTCQDDHILFISCNSHNQLLVCTSRHVEHALLDRLRLVEQLTLSLRDNNSLKSVWERGTKWYVDDPTPHFTFSPEEEFVVAWGFFHAGYGLHILDAKTGETRHILLKDQDDIVDCKFVDCEFLICCSEDNFLRLFNIRSGDLLSVLDIEERPYCLGACLGKPLVAIGLSGARLKYIHVKLPSVTAAEDKRGKK